MKTIILKTLLFIAIALRLSYSSAQVSVNLNFGTPPVWGPAGYTDVRYYYLPDIEAYYDVQYGVFIYQNSGRWMRMRSLPPQYRDYDLNRGPKIVINGYYGGAPYTYFSTHRGRYPRGYDGDDIVYRHNSGRGYREGRGGYEGNHEGHSDYQRHEDHSEGHGNRDGGNSGGQRAPRQSPGRSGPH